MQKYTEKELRYMDHHMKNAINAAHMSCSNKMKVGCVIVKNNRVIVNGWNGRLANQDNCCEELSSLCSCGHMFSKDILSDIDSGLVGHGCVCPKCHSINKWRLRTREDVVHAEENTLLYAAKEGISVNKASAYTTTAPCIKCARMLVGVGVSDVFYLHDYKNLDGIELLNSTGINICKMKIVDNSDKVISPDRLYSRLTYNIVIDQ